jgi:hypothetical protein
LLGPYFLASATGGSIDMASSGNRGRYHGENQEFFHACGIRGSLDHAIQFEKKVFEEVNFLLKCH